MTSPVFSAICLINTDKGERDLTVLVLPASQESSAGPRAKSYRAPPPPAPVRAAHPAVIVTTTHRGPWTLKQTRTQGLANERDPRVFVVAFQQSIKNYLHYCQTAPLFHLIKTRIPLSFSPAGSGSTWKASNKCLPAVRSSELPGSTRALDPGLDTWV